MPEIKAPKRHPMARLNTRIELSQQRYVKKLAKTSNRTEGEIFRTMIREYIESKKRKV